MKYFLLCFLLLSGTTACSLDTKNAYEICLKNAPDWLKNKNAEGELSAVGSAYAETIGTKTSEQIAKEKLREKIFPKVVVIIERFFIEFANKKITKNNIYPDAEKITDKIYNKIQIISKWTSAECAEEYSLAYINSDQVHEIFQEHGFDPILKSKNLEINEKKILYYLINLEFPPN